MSKFEDYVLYTFIFGIIIYMLSNKQEFLLVVLLYIIKSLEINFYYAVLSFSFAIYQGIKSNRKLLFSI